MADLHKPTFYAWARRAPFGGKLLQSQVDGCEAIFDAWEQHGDHDHRKLAYIFATAFHEVGGRMQPVREGFATSDAAARRAVNALARKRGPNSAVARYAKPTGPYGHVYYGRGYPQLTWIENYEREGDALGVDLVRHPDKLLEAPIAARVLVDGMMKGRFTGRALGQHFGSDVDDAVGARRIVNGTDKASLIAGYHRHFRDALRAAREAAVNARPPETTAPDDADMPLLVAILAAALGAFGWHIARS